MTDSFEVTSVYDVPPPHLLKFAAVAGALRGVLRIPFEHPFDTVKTRWQADPSFKSATDVFLSIYKNGGWRELYSGAVPSGIRSFIKEGYRFPLMIGLPQLYGNLLYKYEPQWNILRRKEVGISAEQTKPKSIYVSPERSTRIKVACGMSIGIIEAITSCPFERLKVLLMTRAPNITYDNVLYGVFQPRTRIFSIMAGSNPVMRDTALLPYLFKGFNPLLLRQLLSWVTFLGGDVKCKNIVRNITERDELGFISLGAIAIIVGIMNTTVVMPIDAIKTHVQRYETLNSSVKQVKDLHMYRFKNVATAQWIYQTYGIRGFFVGYSARMCQYILSSFFTVPILEMLESKRLPLKF